MLADLVLGARREVLDRRGDHGACLSTCDT
jgi:hypothetical protein